MRYILRLLYRNNHILLFCLLEFLALYFVFNFNHFHNTKYVNSANKTIGKIYNTRDNITSYFSLRAQNEELALENANLRKYKKQALRKLNNNLIRVDDSLYLQQYEYIPAKVVNISTNSARNYATLNIGKLEGVERDMGVITANGIVGFVEQVSNHFCTVRTVIHRDFNQTIRSRRTKVFGPTQWDGTDPQLVNWIEIPSHVPIKKGDVLETWESTGRFPEGIMVGTVQEIHHPTGEKYYDIKVKLTTDFRKLKHAYVVKNILKKELQQLEKSTLND